jgi:hypothetical protein
MSRSIVSVGFLAIYLIYLNQKNLKIEYTREFQEMIKETFTTSLVFSILR